jgi:mono/diheme cytochrome c family protein
MRLLLKILLVLLGVLLAIAAGLYTWASVATNRALHRTIDTHRVDFPIPFPLAEEEAAGLDDAGRRDLAAARAVERGRHLVESRYVCIECHGANFGGGVMVDAFPIGRLLGPNLTAGRGSRTLNYTPADWDRIVRHGVLPDGRPAAMPSEEFQMMSDQELSDVVSYLGTFPPVDSDVPAPSLGPLGKVLLATGEMHLSADQIASHHAAHPAYPPAADVSAEFGRHVSGVCMGCHRPDLSGGPVVGGDPAWPPASNLTPHPEALGGWTYPEFVRAMRNGVRPDGTSLQAPMSTVTAYTRNMTDIEMQALWAYLQSLPPVAPQAGN